MMHYTASLTQIVKKRNLLFSKKPFPTSPYIYNTCLCKVLPLKIRSVRGCSPVFTSSVQLDAWLIALLSDMSNLPDRLSSCFSWAYRLIVQIDGKFASAGLAFLSP